MNNRPMNTAYTKKLALIAYPELSVADNDLIAECRKEHDKLYPII